MIYPGGRVHIRGFIRRPCPHQGNLSGGLWGMYAVHWRCRGGFTEAHSPRYTLSLVCRHAQLPRKIETHSTEEFSCWRPKWAQWWSKILGFMTTTDFLFSVGIRNVVFVFCLSKVALHSPQAGWHTNEDGHAISLNCGRLATGPKQA